MAEALTAGGVSVRYLKGDFREVGIKDYILQKIRKKYKVEDFWAVKNVSFTLEQGQFLGILGRNGAGKSTLLKAVSGIMRPTKGFVDLHGNHAMYLDYGSGLDGQLTVSENIYLRGAIQGTSRAVVRENHDRILDFAELTEYRDSPLRTLSSGMKSRLAFTISCLISPDILILDETFAVGDPVFIKKSERELLRILNSGVTVVMVTHNVGQIRRLCTRAMWLDHGEEIQSGGPQEVCDFYEAFLKEERAKQEQRIMKQKLLEDAENG
jgi:ABC-2 type transport system ATP-binding protein